MLGGGGCAGLYVNSNLSNLLFRQMNCEVKYDVYLLSSYLKRYWKKALFDSLDKLRATLDRIYGEGKVTLIDASLRWMYHHSKMDGACGGMYLLSFHVFLFPKHTLKCVSISQHLIFMRLVLFLSA